MEPTQIVWLRRDLRRFDHAALASACEGAGRIQPIFIFDTEILARFENRQDRRLSFIAAALVQLHKEFKEHGGGLLVLHGKPIEIVPKLAKALSASTLTAAADFEPDTRARDKAVAEALPDTCEFKRVKDHLIFAPHEILKDDGTPYKVFTPYSKAWKAKLKAEHIAERKVVDKGRYADLSAAQEAAKKVGLTVLDTSQGEAALLKAVGYEYAQDALWPADEGRERLHGFVREGAVSTYKSTRDFMANTEGTSRLSPYLRFGLVSVRECARLAVERENHETWLNEIIWREFYAMILHHYPHTPTLEFQEKYQHTLEWSENREHFEAWCEGRTGYPVVDAAMRQLKKEGWMHNRARMIVASFLTKDLHLDWRWGEEHFAQWLMDYDMASNVGGWQWAASTGTDAQPYFRIFNPESQSKRFDEEGDYIRGHVPELADLGAKAIHAPSAAQRPSSYPAPMVEHKQAREKALEMFKRLK